MIPPINLLPPEPKLEEKRVKKRTATRICVVLLVGFLLVNLTIFGLYWILTKKTADTLAAIKHEETKISALVELERLYRDLSAKLSFLGGIWQKEIAAQGAVDFAQALTIPEVTLIKILFKEDGSTTLVLSATNSDGLEKFLEGVTQREESGQIEDVKLASTIRTQEGGYNFNLSFKYLGPTK